MGAQQSVTCGTDTVERDGSCVSTVVCPPQVKCPERECEACPDPVKTHAVSGWHPNHIDVGIVPNVSTMNQCLQYGVQNDLPAVGWRNADHGQTSYKNTCWAHGDGFDHAKADAFIQQNGNPNDTVHTTFIFKHG